MTAQKSKRQQRRSRNSSNSRSITIGVIVVGALLIAIALIYPNLKSPAEVIVLTPEAVSRPQTDGLTVGDVNSPAKIEVFEDFQCPACVSFTQDIEPLVISQLVETGKAYYVFHNYPFLDRNSITKESQDSANASLCANEQGKFWEYHDTLFANWNGENEGNLSGPRLIQFASAVDLNVDDFTACLDEDRYAGEIQASLDLGSSMGVSGTPTVFVNGQQISPGYIPSLEDIATAVEAVQK